MKRRKYTNEFKLAAVKMAERGDVSVAQLSRDLGICETVLYK
ncbi:transposase [bacterium]|nr:transposase [bacterium]